MKTSIVMTGLLCISLSAACERALDVESDERPRRAAAEPADEPRRDVGDPEAVTVTGCLTTADGRFVLTELQPVAGVQPGGRPETGVPTTETYELVQLEDQLRPHVGRQVRVYGQAEPTRVAEVRERTPQTGPTGTTGPESGSDRARVNTESRVRVEMRKLRISTVTPTGAPCAA